MGDDYFEHLQTTMPELKLCDKRFETASYVASPELSTALKYRLIAPRLRPKVLFIGSPFEPYMPRDATKPIPSFARLKSAAMDLETDLVTFTNMPAEAKPPNHFYGVPSYPNTRLSLRESSFEEFLDRFSAPWRNSIRRNLALFSASGFRIQRETQTFCSKQAYENYLTFYHQASFKWLKKPQVFFENLERLKSSVLLVCTHGKTQVGFLSAFRFGNELHLGRIGITASHYKKHGVYFALHYAMIDFALKNNMNTLFLGPTAYTFKKNLGCEILPTRNWVLPISRPWQAALWLAKPTLPILFSHLDN